MTSAGANEPLEVGAPVAPPRLEPPASMRAKPDETRHAVPEPLANRGPRAPAALVAGVALAVMWATPVLPMQVDDEARGGPAQTEPFEARGGWGRNWGNYWG